MKSVQGIGLDEVRDVYNGVEGQLWELIMGQQIHIGGLKSSIDLANKAGIGPGMRGIDLCCCTGGGMRFLVKFANVDSMIGVDATPLMIDKGLDRNQELRLSDRIQFLIADASNTGLDSEVADFVWGEDAWCYVVDKSALIAEAARLIKPGGSIAFTDWIEGPVEMTEDESARFLKFMKFPNIQDLKGYTDLLEKNECETLFAENTGRYAPCIDLYLQMLDMQLTYDALKLIDFDMSFMQALAQEMAFIQSLAHQNKIIQGLFVARKR